VMFLQRFDGIAPADGLYVIEMGSNDIRDALVAFAVAVMAAPFSRPQTFRSFRASRRSTQRAPDTS
jgi:hypothetical protein